MDGARQLANEKREISIFMGKHRANMILSEVKKETNRDLDNVIKSTKNAYAAVIPAVQKNISKLSKEITKTLLKD